ncbi:acyl-CoA thioesterase II, partial [Pseudomonas shirazica]
MIDFIPENVRASFMRERHVEIRPIDPVNPFQPQPQAPTNAHYIRTHDQIRGEMDQVALHQAIVAFYSDFTLMTTALKPHGLSYISPSLQCASIDHTIYFH